MSTYRRPLLKTDEFLPGLGEQHEVGLSNVGVSVVTATIACNTSMTAAELIAAPPNTGVAAACGPVVHSLGATPTMVFAQHRVPSEETGLAASVTYQFCTANHSAAYFWAKTWTGTAPVGVETQVIAIR